MTVPGERTFFQSEYFWVMERESFPGGMFIPSFIAKSLISLTALYNLEFSPILLAGHIQLALNEIFVIPFSIGAHIIFVKDYDKQTFFFVELIDNKGVKVGFKWIVEKVLDEGEYKNCWMTTSVSQPMLLSKSI